MMNKFTATLKALLIGVSFYSVKKAIDRAPEMWRKPLIIGLRSGCYLTILLILFSFLSGRAVAVSENLHLATTMHNILVSLFFIVSLLLSFFLTAILEGVYRAVSDMTAKSTEAVEKAQGMVADVKKRTTDAFDLTRKAFADSGSRLFQAGEAVYNVSRDLADSGMHKTSEMTHKLSERGKELFDDAKPKTEKFVGKLKAESEKAVGAGKRMAQRVGQKSSELFKHDSKGKQEDQE